MAETVFEVIDRLLDEIDGELTSRSRVVDGLLDIRNASSEGPLVEVVDGALNDIPGRTTVENSWWLSRLEQLGDQARDGDLTTV